MGNEVGLQTEAVPKGPSDGRLRSFVNRHDGGDSAKLVSVHREISGEVSGSDPWYRMGMLYGGPLAYGYCRFVSANHSGDARVLFASRDGYSLMKALKIVSPDIGETGYVNAQRLVARVVTGRTETKEDKRCNLRFFSKCLGLDGVPSDIDGMFSKNRERIAELRRNFLDFYGDYVSGMTGDAESLELVDSTTAEYSSQKLIEQYSGRKVAGRYLVTLGKGESPEHMTYGHVDGPYFGGYKVNLREFFLCSPELPLCGWDGENPIHTTDCPLEEERAANYEKICSGICDYARRVEEILGDDLPTYSYETVSDWILMALHDSGSKALLSRMYWSSDPDHFRWNHLVPRFGDIPRLTAEKASKALGIYGR